MALSESPRGWAAAAAERGALTSFFTQACLPRLQPFCSRNAVKSVVLIPQQLQYFMLEGGGKRCRLLGAVLSHPSSPERVAMLTLLVSSPPTCEAGAPGTRGQSPPEPPG